MPGLNMFKYEWNLSYSEGYLMQKYFSFLHTKLSYDLRKFGIYSEYGAFHCIENTGSELL